MGLNLKSDEAHRLARQVAEVTGESMTKAVVVSLRERLERLKREPSENRVQRILAIGRDCAAHLGEAYRSLDHDALLYDEKTGLPRDC